jgi:hypothetical protein
MRGVRTEDDVFANTKAQKQKPQKLTLNFWGSVYFRSATLRA